MTTASPSAGASRIRFGGRRLPSPSQPDTTGSREDSTTIRGRTHPVNGQPRGVPILRLLGGQLAIGAAAIFARLALGGAGPIAVSALRLVLATLALVALGARARPLGPARELALGIAGLALAAHFGAWIASLEFTSVPRSTLLVTTTPLWLAFATAIRTRRLPSRALGIALAVAFAGVAIVVGVPTGVAPVPGHEALGEALALAGALAIGAYLELVRATGSRGTDALPTGDIVLRTYGWAALALVIGAGVLREPPPALGDGRAWLGVAGMAFISQLLGHTALARALRDFSPTTVAISTLLEPAIAAGLAALIFGETVGPWLALGAALLLAGIALALRAERSNDS